MWEIILERCTKEKRSEALAEDFPQLFAMLPLTTIQLAMDVDNCVTCSDASEEGGSVSRSVGPTKRGVDRLEEAMAETQGKCADELLLVEHCAGIGAARRALEVLGVRPGGHIVTEINEAAIRTLQANYPAAELAGDLEECTSDKLLDCLGGCMSPKFILETAGTPCQDLSSANAAGARLEGKRSSLFFTLEEKSQLYKEALPEAKVARILENVASMQAEARDVITAWRGVLPYKCCPSGEFPVRRPRFFWCDWEVPEQEGLRIKKGEDFYTLSLAGEALKVKHFLPSHLKVLPGFKAFPCFMQSLPRKRPPLRPAGIDTCDDTALERWEKDAFRFPPYQYREDNIVQCSRTKRKMTPPVEVREDLMGFRRDFIFECFAAAERKRNPKEHEDARLCLLGSSIHVPVLAMLLAPQLQQWGFLDELPSMNDIIARTGRNRKPKVADERLLVLAYVNRQTHRGGEIKLENGPQRLQERPKPQAIDAGQWRWQHVVSCAWQCKDEHISALEARGYYLCLMWRTRRVEGLSKKFLHLLDSMTAFGAMVKHRSPSPATHYLVWRVAAIELAADLAPILGYVRSHRNPSDKPSRQMIKTKNHGAKHHHYCSEKSVRAKTGLESPLHSSAIGCALPYMISAWWMQGFFSLTGEALQ